MYIYRIVVIMAKAMSKIISKGYFCSLNKPTCPAQKPNNMAQNFQLTIQNCNLKICTKTLTLINNILNNRSATVLNLLCQPQNELGRSPLITKMFE